MYLSTHKVQVRYLSFIYILAFFGVRKIPCVFVESSTYRQLVKKFRNYVFFPKFGYRNYRYDQVYVCQKNLLIAQTIFLFDQKTNVRLLSPSKIAKKIANQTISSDSFRQLHIQLDGPYLDAVHCSVVDPDPRGSGTFVWNQIRNYCTRSGSSKI